MLFKGEEKFWYIAGYPGDFRCTYQTFHSENRKPLTTVHWFYRLRLWIKWFEKSRPLNKNKINGTNFGVEEMSKKSPNVSAHKENLWRFFSMVLQVKMQNTSSVNNWNTQVGYSNESCWTVLSLMLFILCIGWFLLLSLWIKLSSVVF